MRNPLSGTRRALAGLGALLLAFLVLPLLTILLGSSPASLVATAVDPQVLRTVRVTFGSAAIATLLGLVTGVPLAYLLARHRFRGKHLVEGLLGLPVIVPHTSAGVALLLTYGARGLLGRPLGRLGLFFTDRVSGIVLAMLFVGAPYVVTTAREAIARVSPDLEQSALVDGATLGQALRYVTLPLATRGITAGALLMWARGISEFGAVVLLAYHPRTLAVLVYERFQGFGLAQATPLAALLVLLALVVFICLGRLTRLREDWET